MTNIPRSVRRDGEESLLVQTKTEELRQRLCLRAEDHAHGKNDHIERLFHDAPLEGVRHSDPEIAAHRRMVDLRGEGPDEPDPPVGPAGGEELMEGRPCRLDVHVEECRVDTGMGMSDRPDETEGIGAADLGAVEIPDRFVAASHALDKGDVLGLAAVGGAAERPPLPKHLFELPRGYDVFGDAVPVFAFPGGIVGIDPRRDDERRRSRIRDLPVLPVRYPIRARSSRHCTDLGPGKAADSRLFVYLPELPVRDAGKALVARLRCLAAETRRKPAEGRLFLHQDDRNLETVELQRTGDAGDAAADDEYRMIVVSSHCVRQFPRPARQKKACRLLPVGNPGGSFF